MRYGTGVQDFKKKEDENQKSAWVAIAEKLRKPSFRKLSGKHGSETVQNRNIEIFPQKVPIPRSRNSNKN